MSKVFQFEGGDPDMLRAYEAARATFRYFWREVAWDRHRIIPALELACVKAPFSDGPPSDDPPDHPEVEHMWIDDVEFDGEQITGVLLNEPNWLTSVSAGDTVSVPLEEISDWMYSLLGDVYGAHTVNLIRSRMGARERKEHDEAWGREFGDPNHIRLVPEMKKSGGMLKSLFGAKSQPLDEEHPMSAGMAEKLREQLAEEPTLVYDADENGWTLLHRQALAGNLAVVQVLLDCGANPQAVTDQGWTPLMFAQSLKWEKVVALLKAAEGRGA
jgi:uncharacterized protein YegJ (DUF2314 family)